MAKKLITVGKPVQNKTRYIVLLSRKLRRRLQGDIDWKTEYQKAGGIKMQEVYDFLKKCGTYYLATVDGDQPRVRPFGTVDIFEGKLYIQTGKVKECSKQLHKNPKAEICAFDGPTGTWIRVSGKLIPDDRREAKKHMLDSYPNSRGMYSEDDDNSEVLYFEDAEAVFSSFTSAPRTVKF
jgi:uncharacterized pyridoxamine 5'-phosphate oxidase family protein